MLMAGRMHPPFLFCRAKRETGRARSKEKSVGALRCSGPPRDGGRRIGASADLARPSGTLYSSAISPTAVPWRIVRRSSGWSSHGAASLFAAASCPARELPIKASAPTTARAARSEAERAERGAGQMRPCTPLTSASTPRESAFKPVPHPAAPVGQSSQTRRHHLTPTPVQQLCTPVQSCGQKRSFLLNRARPVFFSGKTEKKMGGASRWTSPLREQRFPRPPDGGPLQLPPVRPASQIIQRYAEMVRQGDQRVQAGPVLTRLQVLVGPLPNPDGGGHLLLGFSLFLAEFPQSLV